MEDTFFYRSRSNLALSPFPIKKISTPLSVQWRTVIPPTYLRYRPRRLYLHPLYKVSSPYSASETQCHWFLQITTYNVLYNYLESSRKVVGGKIIVTNVPHALWYLPCVQFIKTDGRILKEIVVRNVSCVKDNDELKLIIYYKNKQVNQLVTNNNPTKKTESLQQTNVIYEFSCRKEDCKHLQNIKYIGMTSQHWAVDWYLSLSGPKQRMENVHH